jgi:hypothetical protein
VSQSPQYPNQPQGPNPNFGPAQPPMQPLQPMQPQRPVFTQPPAGNGPGMPPGSGRVTATKRAWFKSPWVLAPVTFIVGLVIGLTTADGSTASAAAGATTTVTATSTKTADAKPAATVTVTGPAVTVTAAAAPAAPAAPAGIKDGSYMVGTEIALGTWKSSGGGSLCYADTTDQAGNILEQEVGASGANVIIRIKAGAYTFKSSGCGTWTKVG